MHHMFHCVNLFGRSWRTWKLKIITPTYLMCVVGQRTLTLLRPSPRRRWLWSRYIGQHYTIYGIQCHMQNCATYTYTYLHMLRIHQWSTNSLSASPHGTCYSCALANILAWVCSKMLWSVCLCYTTIYKFTKSVHKWQQSAQRLKSCAWQSNLKKQNSNRKPMKF